MKATDKQIGGNHYKGFAIQPIVFATLNNLNPCQYSVLKYVCRYKGKNGKQDLEKALHFIDLFSEFQKDFGVQGFTIAQIDAFPISVMEFKEKNGLSGEVYCIIQYVCVGNESSLSRAKELIEGLIEKHYSGE